MDNQADQGMVRLRDHKHDYHSLRHTHATLLQKALENAYFMRVKRQQVSTCIETLVCENYQTNKVSL